MADLMLSFRVRLWVLQVYSHHVNRRVSIVGHENEGAGKVESRASDWISVTRDHQSLVHGLNLFSVQSIVVCVCNVSYFCCTFGFVFQSYDVKIQEITKELSLYV